MVFMANSRQLTFKKLIQSIARFSWGEEEWRAIVKLVYLMGINSNQQGQARELFLTGAKLLDITKEDINLFLSNFTFLNIDNMSVCFKSSINEHDEMSGSDLVEQITSKLEILLDSHQLSMQELNRCNRTLKTVLKILGESEKIGCFSPGELNYYLVSLRGSIDTLLQEKKEENEPAKYYPEIGISPKMMLLVHHYPLVHERHDKLFTLLKYYMNIIEMLEMRNPPAKLLMWGGFVYEIQKIGIDSHAILANLNKFIEEVQEWYPGKGLEEIAWELRIAVEEKEELNFGNILPSLSMKLRQLKEIVDENDKRLLDQNYLKENLHYGIKFFEIFSKKTYTTTFSRILAEFLENIAKAKNVREMALSVAQLGEFLPIKKFKKILAKTKIDMRKYIIQIDSDQRQWLLSVFNAIYAVSVRNVSDEQAKTLVYIQNGIKIFNEFIEDKLKLVRVKHTPDRIEKDAINFLQTNLIPKTSIRRELQESINEMRTYSGDHSIPKVRYTGQAAADELQKELNNYTLNNDGENFVKRCKAIIEKTHKVMKQHKATGFIAAGEKFLVLLSWIPYSLVLASYNATKVLIGHGIFANIKDKLSDIAHHRTGRRKRTKAIERVLKRSQRVR